MALMDLTGHTYGRLTVVERAEGCIINATPKPRWVCTCACGGITVVSGQRLREGKTRSCGCLKREHSARLGRSKRIENPVYGTVHRRLTRERGYARDHSCVDCGGPAKDWSYDHADPDELTEVVTRGRMEGMSMTYSADIQHYEPRCKPCHVRFDKGR